MFPESAADAAAVNPKGIKTLLTNGLIKFLIKGSPAFNGPCSPPRNPPDFRISLDNLISVDKLFAKALRRFATCLPIS